MPGDGRSRLSYRRAEEIFEENTRLLANPPASSDDIEDLDGWTQHRLRHSALTHDAEDGTSTPMLLARSRHASVRSLERYARPSVDAVAGHIAGKDPAAHRRDDNGQLTVVQVYGTFPTYSGSPLRRSRSVLGGERRAMPRRGRVFLSATFDGSGRH
ncbi:hypothetical protein AB0B06_32430 [Streptomyces sp. NPDC044989]|uniref:hypothetical protein n=1 Tax=Streptomyces sp. NPDC044989 TaxID=3154336 RepID=UPI0033EC561E